MSIEIRQGERVPVPCKVGPGAFPDEYLITVNTAEGEISGFINTVQVDENSDGAFIRGVVLGVMEDRISIKLPGSFFTTSGIAHFYRKMLNAAQ